MKRSSTSAMRHAKDASLIESLLIPLAKLNTRITPINAPLEERPSTAISQVDAHSSKLSCGSNFQPPPAGHRVCRRPQQPPECRSCRQGQAAHSHHCCGVLLPDSHWLAAAHPASWRVEQRCILPGCKLSLLRCSGCLQCASVTDSS